MALSLFVKVDKTPLAERLWNYLKNHKASIIFISAKYGPGVHYSICPYTKKGSIPGDFLFFEEWIQRQIQAPPH